MMGEKLPARFVKTQRAVFLDSVTKKRVGNAEFPK
jgi:hypothetical protein